MAQMPATEQNIFSTATGTSLAEKTKTPRIDAPVKTNIPDEIQDSQCRKS